MSSCEGVSCLYGSCVSWSPMARSSSLQPLASSCRALGNYLSYARTHGLERLSSRAGLACAPWALMDPSMVGAHRVTMPQFLPCMALWASSLWLTGLVISCSFSLCIWAYTVLPGRFLLARGIAQL